MRLLNTTTFRFQEFSSNKDVKYAILSHRWGKDEVLYDDYLKCKHTPGAGLHKIIYFCQYANTQGYEWGWIDSCCIDRASSNEISESINAMFNWYYDAALCVVYLADVDAMDLETQLPKSVWFTRGWTLQELLAPLKLHFLDSNWTTFAALEKSNRHRPDSSEVITSIANAAGVPFSILTCDWRWQLDPPSIAQIMSWASRRVTPRLEDATYCLLGLLNCTMPLLYGEGRQAFKRLQRKLIKSRQDDTIFHWTPHYDPDSPFLLYLTQGMLASHPSDFLDCGEISSTWTTLRRRHAWTSRGIEYYAPGWLLGDRQGRSLRDTAFEFFVVQTSSQNPELRSTTCEIILCKETGADIYQRITHLAFRRWCGIEVEDCLRTDIGYQSFLIETNASALTAAFDRKEFRTSKL